MRHFHGTLAATIGLVASIAAAQAGGSNEAATRADAILNDVIKTYVDAKALSDDVTFTYTIPDEPESEMDVSIRIDRSTGSAKFDAGDMALTAVDGKLYLESSDVRRKYFQTDLQTDIATTLESVFGGGGGLPFHFYLDDDAKPDDLIAALNVGSIADLKVTSVDSVTGESGDAHTVVSMTGANDDTLKIFINPKSNLIAKTQTEITEPMAGEGVKVVVAGTYAATVTESLDKPITFDPAGRKMVSNIMEFRPSPLEVGDAAPDFTLTSSDGDAVTLSDMRGTVVVLDFWATWCGPCKMGLPLLQKFHEWTETEGKPVHVYGVNVWERAQDLDARRTLASDYWTGQKFTMPTLFDLEANVASDFGVAGIPATFVIGPDGNIAAVHVGFDPNMVEKLKTDTAEAMKQASTTG